MELWKDIPNTDGMLQVSSDGRVRSKLRGEWRVLKTQVDESGYLRLSYTFKRERRREKIHRLVARMFIPAVQGKTQVNHINCNKTDNRACNLEWCTHDENVHHAIANGLWDTVFAGSKKANDKQRRSVLATNIKTGEVIRFRSVCDAQKACGTKHVCSVIHGMRTKAKGYVFKYAG